MVSHLEDSTNVGPVVVAENIAEGNICEVVGSSRRLEEGADVSLFVLYTSH